MVYFKLCEVLTILCIISKTTAFKCWVCSSDEPGTAYCGKVLDEQNLSHNQRLVNLVECSYPHFDLTKGRDLITKCMIQKTTNNGQIVYYRSCAWEEKDAQKDACLAKTLPFGHTIVTCETCVHDKCNDRLLCESNNSNDSMLTVALYDIMFICLMITLMI